MDRTIPMLLIGLVFGGGIGFVIAAGNGVTFDGHDHNNPAHHGSGSQAMDHDTPIVLQSSPAPTLALELTPDPKSGYNLHIKTTNFTFAPQSASQQHVSGQGHAHVYVNGKKIARHYSPWMHIESLREGAVVKVSLNANSHQPLKVNDALLEAKVKVP